MHIGIMRLSALGDAILLIPAIRAIQKRYPTAKITWITSKAVFAMLEGLSGVNFIVIEKPSSISDYWSIKKQFSSIHFDVLLCMQASLRANLMYPLLKADRKIGFDNQRARDGHKWFVSEQIEYKDQHLADGFLSFAQLLDANIEHPEWNLELDADQFQWLSQYKHYVCINLSASKDERNWPEQHFVKLIEQLSYNGQIILTGGPSQNEQNLANSVQNKCNRQLINLVGKTTPKQLLALLSQCHCLIAPDTGPVHMARAFGRPVIGLYAVARSELSGPYQQLDFTLDAYAQACSQYLNEDNPSWHQRVHDQRAMSLIEVDDVLAQFVRITPN